MARAPAGFPAAQQASLAKRVKMAVGGVKAAGERVGEVIISPEGVIRILTGSPNGTDGLDRESANEWDEVLRA